jgi:hypothetical protein
MFFINALKDYVDHINYILFNLNENFTIFIFFKSFFLYIYNSLYLLFIYIISFKWINDFIELPANFKHNYIAILEGKNLFETTLEIELDKNFFSFFEYSSLNSKNFFTGFFNSFFLALPFSIPQILSIRTLLINGIPAGICSALGTIFGQFIFFSLILFGFEFVIVPFLMFEPFNILLGLFLLVNLLYNMIHNPNMKILNFSQTNKNILFKLFGLNFILSWTEQTSIYNFFGNITINSSSNLLEINYPSDQFIFFNNIFYLLGILVGSLIFTILFGFLIINISNLIYNTILSKTSFIILNERFHYISLSLITILCFNNIPYYGFDYLIYGPLGFISEDRFLDNNLPKVVYNSFKRSKDKPAIITIAINPLNFDKSDLIKTEPKTFLKYEQYSLQSETFWKNRNYLRSDQRNSSRKQIKSNEKNNFKKIQFEVPNYDTPNLELYSTKLQKKENAIEEIFIQLFRNDIYLGYQDANSKNQIKQVQIHREFREKYYNNPIYKALINLDMYPFLLGQPKNYNLSINDEINLFKNRLVLQNYLNTIQDYKKLVKTNKESYCEKVYNQQFKGSLSLIRHFNAVDLNFDFNQNNSLSLTGAKSVKKVLKYDQPQYNYFLNENKIFLHEELNKSNLDSSKYMILNNTTPFYIGWDTSLRKFLIKASDVPENLKSGDFSFNIEKNDQNLKYKYLPSYFSFQSWSPGIETIKKNGNLIFKLPSLQVSYEQLANLKKTLKFDIDKNNTSRMLKTSTNKVINKQTADYLLTRLPNYNWYRVKPSFDLKSQKYLELGETLPSRLDGIAWPGINDKLLLNKLLNK